MKFLLHKDLGQTAIREIGNRLRARGSGHHWIEKYRGDVFINVADDRDEDILRREFLHFVDPVDNSDDQRG